MLQQNTYIIYTEHERSTARFYVKPLRHFFLASLFAQKYDQLYRDTRACLVVSQSARTVFVLGELDLLTARTSISRLPSYFLDPLPPRGEEYIKNAMEEKNKHTGDLR
jgi:hypothetical protein